MVRFALHVAPLFLVREQIHSADEYRLGGPDRFANEDLPVDHSWPAAAGSVQDPTPSSSTSRFSPSDAAALDSCREAPAPGSFPETVEPALVDAGAAPDPFSEAAAPGSFPVTAEPGLVDGADAAIPDPFDDADALEELEDEIATLAAHIHAATHRLLTLVAEFDRRRGWELGGHRSCAYWLSACTGIDLGAAREKVRAARALEALPETRASMARGELSFSKVRALTRVATEANEGALLELARGCTTAQLERMVRGFRRGSRDDEGDLDKARHERRSLSVFPDEEGMYVVKGRLPAEVGALLMRAVEAASDALYREEREPGPRADTQQAAAQRRADALGLLAERALAAGFAGRGGGGGETGAENGENGAQNGAENGEAGTENGENGAEDGETGTENGKKGAANGPEPAAPEQVPISGTRAERYQVVLHVEAETLRAEGEPGRSELEDGTNVSAETSRRLSCDVGLVRVHHGPDGSILDVGRRTRTIPPALRRALDVRDRGCRFPGCGLRFAEGHHVIHWAEGGETSLGNCLLLCRYHHRLVHEGGWRVEWWGQGRPVFFDPRGGTHFDGRWQPLEGGQNPPQEPARKGQAADREMGGDGGGEGGGGGRPGEERVGAGSRPGEQRMEAGSRPEEQRPEAGMRPVTVRFEEDPVAVLSEEKLVASLMEKNRARGANPDGWTAGVRWKREADIPDRVYFRALEAMQEAGP